MSRILFQQAPGKFRTVRGELIRRIQQGLQIRGLDVGTADGVYGPRTMKALSDFQNANGLSATGKVDTETWGKLVSGGIPTIRDRCLQLTADFEGHGFTKAVGNFDQAGLTWGIIGFTLKNGELQKILEEIESSCDDCFREAFGPLAEKMLEVLERPRAGQMQWAEDISIGSNAYKIIGEWGEAFARLGSYPQVQRLQIEHTQSYWDIALRDAARFNLRTELGLALCFDSAVQNGGIDADEAESIRKKLDPSSPKTEQDVRAVIANVIAEGSKPRWVEDVRRRKLTLALGHGMVHEAQYLLSTWGIDELPS